MAYVEQGPFFPLYVNDDGTVGKEYRYGDGSAWRVNDARMIDVFERSESMFRDRCGAYHERLMGKGVKAYRCNDGWVDRKRCKVTFFSHERTEGYYWGSLFLSVGDRIFIGCVDNGGRFAEIIRCGELTPGWGSRDYYYRPLEETLDGCNMIDGTPSPFITKFNAPRLSLLDRICGRKIPRLSMDICEGWPAVDETKR